MINPTSLDAHLANRNQSAFGGPLIYTAGIMEKILRDSVRSREDSVEYHGYGLYARSCLATLDVDEASGFCLLGSPEKSWKIQLKYELAYRIPESAGYENVSVPDLIGDSIVCLFSQHEKGGVPELAAITPLVHGLWNLTDNASETLHRVIGRQRKAEKAFNDLGKIRVNNWF